MTEWPEGVGFIFGFFAGVLLRALVNAAAQSLGGGRFRRLAMIEMVGAVLVGTAFGWLHGHPEAAPWPLAFTQAMGIGFIALAPNFRRDPNDPIFRMILVLGAAIVGLVVGLQL